MTTITEDYVSFEIAKLLKEKGFDAKCNKCYAYFADDDIRFLNLEYPKSAQLLSENRYPCITLQMAMKWLREKYYIYADPIKQGNYNDCSEYYTWIVARMGIIHRNSSVVDKLSYKEAVEAALKYSLENLI